MVSRHHLKRTIIYTCQEALRASAKINRSLLPIFCPEYVPLSLLMTMTSGSKERCSNTVCYLQKGPRDVVSRYKDLHVQGGSLASPSSALPLPLWASMFPVQWVWRRSASGPLQTLLSAETPESHMLDAQGFFCCLEGLREQVVV